MANSIAISSGHALYVRGASDIIDEVTEARRVTDKTAEYLRQLGVTTYVFHDDTSRTQNQNLSTIVNFHNSKNRELDVSIHFNSAARTSNPLGVEVLYYDQSGLAANVSQAIANASGLRNRGAKQRKELYFLRKTAKPAILIEVCFVNSTVDVDLYRKNFDAICRAIAETLAGKRLSQPAPQQTASAAPTPTGNIGVGSIVTVAAHATHYQTGQPIADFVKGNRYKVIQVKDVRSGNSTKAFLLDGIMSWVWEQDIVEAGGQAVAPQPQSKKRYIVLPASAATWTVYKLDRPPVKANKANIAGTLRPSKFGGLEYEILEDLGGWVFKIRTGDFGLVKIYGAPSTGAQIVEK
ncbi:N-acetylmuramoyl-L-alanine amidase [Caldifermentibacillus hisashii]|uniref:N-acetylmuramoyl-L-alanine amidase n=1 Tax=Caldifermentibacillus hisashii TaxID=996558 RepID=UPI0031B725BE